MLVTEIVPLLKSKSKNRLKVRLLDGADFVLYKKEISRYHIEEGKELSHSTYETILKEILIPRAKQRALYLLEKQDRTEQNLRIKLKEGGYPLEAIDAAILYAKDYNYINDERYAQNFIKYRCKQKSKKQTFYELSGKGISKETIEKAYMDLLTEKDSNVIFDERQVISDYIQKILTKQGKPDQKEKNRIYNRLLRKGFSSSDILSVLGEVFC